ncbi:hypothetical protein BD626DRAFT_473105 [Schizophyllum amplum]|uniref:Uncharacterized protein n=1 Tax=Schizophyllum amplum TaxID=97359 RepID=A0A550CWI4_9AGAR|nr:hypothetical protein BD626DRAFT_473105 [Auriculariopsis ampla]
MFLRMEYEVKIPRHLPLGLAADVRPYLLDGIMENGSSVQSMLQLRSDGRKRHDALRKKAPTSAWPKEVLEGYAAGEIAYAENLNNRLRDQKDAVSTWIKSSLDDDACYSRLREEPRQARCDALAGIRILDFPEEEEISPGMNACSLVEKDSPAPMPRTGVSSTVMFARAQELAQKDSDNPRGGLGLPDHKDLAQQALERVTHLGSGFASSSPPSSVDVLPANEDLRTPNSTSHDDEGASMRAEASTNMPEPPLMLRSLVIDFYFAEYKRSHDWVFTLQCLNQAYIYLTHSVHKMAALDIYECPAFCLATDGPIGYVYVAYGVKIGSDVLRPFTGPPVLVWIASRDPPKYDLTDYKQTIQFCTFLLCLRHEHAERVRRRFEEVRLSLVARVKQNDPTLRWTLEQQLDELKNKLDAFEQRQDAALRKVERLRRQHDAPTTVEGPAENGGRATSVDSGQPAGRARASGTTATSADSDRASQLARTRKSAKTTSSDVTGAGSSQPAQSQAATPAPGARSSHSQTLLPPQAQKRSARARSSSRVAARNQPLSDASLQVNPAGSSSQAGDSSQANPAETRLRSRAPSRAASGSSQAKPAAASSQAKPRSRAPSMSQSKPGSGSPQTNRTGGPSQPKSSRPAS